MLVLSRGIDQSVQIGDDIKVKVLAIAGGQVRIGIDAPRTITVHRQEVKQRIDAAKDEESPPEK